MKAINKNMKEIISDSSRKLTSKRQNEGGGLPTEITPQ